ncbi:hypothetical protein SprV_0902661800 [Sparganum proliferum]
MSKSKSSTNKEDKPVLSNEELEINLEELSPPVPPDGGWAWMVLLGSVMCMFFVDGLSFSFGVLLSDLQHSFETSKTKMSLAGSLIVGFTLISGPIVSAMSNQFSMRSLVVGGGLVSSLSLFACCFIYNIDVFIVMFGFVTGISFGFIYLPAATVVSQWFHKRRATATGISMCGSSIGSTIYSLFIPPLVRAYTWRGCMAILAAVSLNCVAAGLFFIDLRAYQKLHPVKKKPAERRDSGQSKEVMPRSNEAVDVEAHTHLKAPHSRLSNSLAESPARLPESLAEDPLESTPNDFQEAGDLVSPHQQQQAAAGDGADTKEVFGTATLPGTPVMGAIVSRTADQISANKSPKPEASLIQSITIPVSGDRLKTNANGYPVANSHDRRVPVLTLETVNRIAGSVISAQEGSHGNLSSTLTRSSYRPPPRRRTVSARHHSPTPPVAVEPTTKASLFVRRDPAGRDVLFASAVSLRPTTDLGVPVDKETRRRIVQQLEREVDLPVHKKDFFYSGSMLRVNEYLSSNNVNEYVRTVTSAAEDSGETNYVLKMLRELFDFGLFTSPTFILLITSSVFGLFGYPVPYVFLKDNAQNLGFSAEDSSNLLVYLCAVNTIGRVLAARSRRSRRTVCIGRFPAPNHRSGVPVDKETRRRIVQQLEREVDLPVHKKDFFYSGSMLRVNEYLSSNNVNEYVRTVTSAAEDSGETNYVLKMLRELFDFGLFTSPTFILLITSSVFGLFGYPVPYVFLKDNAQNLGFSAEDSSNLLVYLCAVNTIGRVLAGVLSDRPWTDALFVNNAALIISGFACVLLPLATSYAGQVCFAITYGLAIAAFVSLRIILLVEMLGLDRLTNAFGFLLLFQGLSFMASPPILAGFYDMLQSFDYTFILAGCSLIFSAILCFPLRPILRWEKRRRGEPVPPSHGGGCFTRFLRRIRDHFRRRRERMASRDVS